MKPSNNRNFRLYSAIALTSLAIAGCAATPQSPKGADAVRAKLIQLETNPELANRAADAIEVAQSAVRLAEQPLTDSEADRAIGSHRVYMADHLVDIAAANAEMRYAEDQRAQLAVHRAQSRLDARTREADQAHSRADLAAEQASDDRNAAEAAAATAALESAELKRQIEVLQAEATDRGIVLTLGDLLFAFDSATLADGAAGNLDRLVAFLKEYPNRTALIEGHTDNVGSAGYNLSLSQQRADAVRDHLIRHGIASQRLSTQGLGQTQPLMSNDAAAGRQRNRRVEVIIENPPIVGFVVPAL